MISLNVGQHDRIQGMIDAYHAWCNSFAWHHDQHQPMLINHKQGIPLYQWYDKAGVNASAASVVAIDFVKENPESLMDFFNGVDQNKYYLVFSGACWPTNRLPVNAAHTVCYWPFPLLDLIAVHGNIQSPYYYQAHIYNFDYPKPCLFSHVAGTKRAHRDWLVKNLLPQVGNKNFVFRYQGQDFGQDARSVDLLDQHISEHELAPWFMQFPDEKNYRVSSRSMSMPTYDQSYFALVSETNVDDRAIFVTEKVGRCLMSGQPFVVLGSPGYLEHLQQMGFRTYWSLWDESYDQIKDVPARMQAVKNLVLELQTFDWGATQKQLEEIAMHNRLTMMNWAPFVNTLFENMEKSLQSLDNATINSYTR